MKEKTLPERKERRENLLVWSVSMIITALVFKAFPMVYASSSSQVSSMINSVKLIASVLCSVVGAVYLVWGLIKLAMSTGDGDAGPEQNKAIKMISAAVVLGVLAFFIIPNLDIASWIKTP